MDNHSVRVIELFGRLLLPTRDGKKLGSEMSIRPSSISFLTEKEGGVCFRQIGGRIDYAGFYGKNPIFLNWVRDLFLYYWEKGKRA